MAAHVVSRPPRSGGAGRSPSVVIPSGRGRRGLARYSPDPVRFSAHLNTTNRAEWSSYMIPPVVEGPKRSARHSFSSLGFWSPGGRRSSSKVSSTIVGAELASSRLAASCSATVRYQAWLLLAHIPYSVPSSATTEALAGLPLATLLTWLFHLPVRRAIANERYCACVSRRRSKMHTSHQPVSTGQL